MVATRFRYYFGWLVAEGAAVLAGYGYAGVNSKGLPDWCVRERERARKRACARALAVC